ncbi:MAG: MobF family relaxase [Acidimicrobiales bacterium]
MPAVLTKARLRNVAAMDYYTAWADSTGAEGTWHTRSAAFGINDGDVVSRGHLRKILTGTGARQRVNRHPGFDLTFSCPKSVSLVAFGHPDQTMRAGVISDHEQSVKAALDWLEDHALVTRQTLDGVVTEVPVQSIYAMFRHNTSRAHDPQLHLHVLLPNLGVRPDGELVAIDRHVMNQWKQSVDTIYRLEMRARLGKRGFTFNPADKNGLTDLAGMPRELILKYSKRRKEIEEALTAKESEGGTVTSGDRRQIAVRTREKKLEGRKAAESEDVGPRLRQELEDSGLDQSFWSKMQEGKRTPPVVDKSLATGVATLLLSEGGALASKASWSRPDLLRALATVLPGGLFSGQLD